MDVILITEDANYTSMHFNVDIKIIFKRHYGHSASYELALRFSKIHAEAILLNE